MPEPLDGTLSALLLAVATEPWGSWYPESRLALADLLEERGEADAASLIRDLEVRHWEYALLFPAHEGECYWYIHPGRDERDTSGYTYRTRGRARRECRRRVLDLFSGVVLVCSDSIEVASLEVASLALMLLHYPLAGPGRLTDLDDRDHLPMESLKASAGSGR